MNPEPNIPNMRGAAPPVLGRAHFANFGLCDFCAFWRLKPPPFTVLRSSAEAAQPPARRDTGAVVTVSSMRPLCYLGLLLLNQVWFYTLLRKVNLLQSQFNAVAKKFNALNLQPGLLNQIKPYKTLKPKIACPLGAPLSSVFICENPWSKNPTRVLCLLHLRG